MPKSGYGSQIWLVTISPPPLEKKNCKFLYSCTHGIFQIGLEAKVSKNTLFLGYLNLPFFWHPQSRVNKKIVYICRIFVPLHWAFSYLFWCVTRLSMLKKVHHVPQIYTLGDTLAPILRIELNTKKILSLLCRLGAFGFIFGGSTHPL